MELQGLENQKVSDLSEITKASSLIVVEIFAK